jgi:hypothetical protein
MHYSSMRNGNKLRICVYAWGINIHSPVKIMLTIVAHVQWEMGNFLKNFQTDEGFFPIVLFESVLLLKVKFKLERLSRVCVCAGEGEREISNWPQSQAVVNGKSCKAWKKKDCLLHMLLLTSFQFQHEKVSINHRLAST